MTLIDRDELLEQLWRSDVSSREKIDEIIRNRPVVATTEERIIVTFKHGYQVMECRGLTP